MKNKYYLVRWELRDGEHEYSEFEVVKTDKKFDLYNDEKLFKKCIEEFYLLEKDEKLKKFDDSHLVFELPNDYRLVELSRAEEITRQQYQVILDTHLAYGFIF